MPMVLLTMLMVDATSDFRVCSFQRMLMMCVTEDGLPTKFGDSIYKMMLMKMSYWTDGEVAVLKDGSLH
ncbi:uncharacterized protein LOC111832560 [Capsella rubella]|uniref:uncharacterized protein LOC111832560 n=1 Tax=Capsella rubella TaxID=81985 RepID=UPI000CD5C017|nr:uncharacterized protein LOC111832560 [Capsella rubella]